MFQPHEYQRLRTSSRLMNRATSSKEAQTAIREHGRHVGSVEATNVDNDALDTAGAITVREAPLYELTAPPSLVMAGKGKRRRSPGSEELPPLASPPLKRRRITSVESSDEDRSSTTSRLDEAAPGIPTALFTAPVSRGSQTSADVTAPAGSSAVRPSIEEPATTTQSTGSPYAQTPPTQSAEPGHVPIRHVSDAVRLRLDTSKMKSTVGLAQVLAHASGDIGGENDGYVSTASSELSPVPADLDLSMPTTQDEGEASTTQKVSPRSSQAKCNSRQSGCQISGPATTRSRRSVKVPRRYGVASAAPVDKGSTAAETLPAVEQRSEFDVDDTDEPGHEDSMEQVDADITVAKRKAGGAAVTPKRRRWSADRTARTMRVPSKRQKPDVQSTKDMVVAEPVRVKRGGSGQQSKHMGEDADNPTRPSRLKTRFNSMNTTRSKQALRRDAASTRSHAKRQNKSTVALQSDKGPKSKAISATTKPPRGPARSQGKRKLLVTLTFRNDKLRSVLTSPRPLHQPDTGLPDEVHGLLTPLNSHSEDGDTDSEAVIDVDEKLLELSRKLTQRAPLNAKPAPRGKPEVWADSRQALCETVPYFKMPQSGCHQNDRHIYAFLFDGIGHCREYMDSDVIIARAGGGMEMDSSGRMVQKKDHLMSESQVQSMLNDIEYQNPLVIICGDKNEGSPVEMPHRYNVLGWWKPVTVWAEKTMGKGGRTWTTIKYRFERLDPAKGVWHAAEHSLLTDDDRKVAGDLSYQVCRSCGVEHPLIYLIGWMCLNASCDRFWKIGGRDAPYGKLDYHPAFLLHHTSWCNEDEPYSVRPPIPDVGKTLADNLTYINTRGICCPQCGRCSSRRLFTGWVCDNPDCSYDNFPKHIPVTMPLLHNPWESTGDGPALARNKHEKAQGVHVEISHKFGYKISTYTFDGINGKFVHIGSNAKINKVRGGPDDMFAAMQRQNDPAMDLHLERRRFGIERLAGGRAPLETPKKPRDRLAPSPPLTPAAEHKSKASEHVAGLAEARSAFGTIERRQRALRRKVAGMWSTTDVQSGPEQMRERVDQFGDVADDLTSTEELEHINALPNSGGKSLRLPRTPGQSSTDADVAADEAESPTKQKATAEDGDFMTAFSMNYGMPYKFVASGASLPFTDAPWPVQSCRADLNWASQTFLERKNHVDLNELLIFAYMEGQKIEYHDDGESGLGPQIATMSLGGKAKMHMRMKTKHFVGCSKTGILTSDRPVPGSIGGDAVYRKRLAAWEELQQLKDTDKCLYERRRKELPKELGIFDKRHKKADDLVTMTLNHGDIVLMEGYEVQQYLEHKVVPEQCLRFALTCRTVLPEHLKPHERPAYEVEADDGSKSSLRRMAARLMEAEGERGP